RESPGSDWPRTPGARTAIRRPVPDALCATDPVPVARPGTDCTREYRGATDSKQRLLSHTRRPLIHLSLCAPYAQFVIRIEAGVQGEKFIEHGGEEEQVAFANETLQIHGQIGSHAANRQAAVQ